MDQGPTERKSSPGKAQGLNVHTPMYLGGVPNMDILPKPANVSELFEGCVGEVRPQDAPRARRLLAGVGTLKRCSAQVSINNKKVDLSYSFSESRGVRQCVDASPCDRRPCLNGGQCLSSAEYEYQCLCQDGYEGEWAARLRTFLRFQHGRQHVPVRRGTLRGAEVRLPDQPAVSERRHLRGRRLRVSPRLHGPDLWRRSVRTARPSHICF